MRKIKEVLRLAGECRLSGRAIARTLAMSPTTVTEYLSRARVANLAWPLPPDLDDGELERRLFPPQTDLPPAAARPKADWAYIHNELKRPGVTLQLLWEEYKVGEPDGYQYSRFCELYRRWARRIDVTMRLHHKAGEKLFVDYAGQTVPVVDRHTGEVRPAQIFVAVLGASSYTYAEAAWSQDVPSWVAAHVRTFAFLGGVPAIVVPDNLKSAVLRASRYDPSLHPTFVDMASHYGTAIVPTRVRKPRDKAKVEAGVLLVERWILAALRNQTFFSLAELNAAIRTLIARLNSRPFKKLEGCRLSAFLALDKPALRPLPAQPFELADWRRARVNIDHHIDVDRHYYSAPYHLVHEEVEVRLTERTVEILHRGSRVASHRRSYERGSFTTAPEHRPPNHIKHLEWTPDRVVAWAAKKGPATAALAQAIIDGRDHPEQGLRSCLGIIRLAKAYGDERLEAACRRALHFQTRSYRSVEAILKNNLDGRPLPAPEPERPPLDHENVRGPHYYAEEQPC